MESPRRPSPTCLTFHVGVLLRRSAGPCGGIVSCARTSVSYKTYASASVPPLDPLAGIDETFSTGLQQMLGRFRLIDQISCLQPFSRRTLIRAVGRHIGCWRTSTAMQGQL
ncbi:hypothetical protein OH77DRAFT_294452 [Trametes cingulata]|nr:hypothetical protein OH77DRAFT_294452 [Trametes cingulata]